MWAAGHEGRRHLLRLRKQGKVEENKGKALYNIPFSCELGAHGEERGLRRLGTPHASDWEGCKQRGVDAQDRASSCTTAGNTSFIFLI